MKLAVTGKGGVGKTTVSALIAHHLKASGLDVIAIDADPDANLAACLGYTGSKPIEPLVHLKELIEERTGVKPGTTGGMFRLNPFVEDIPDQYAVDVAGIRLLVAGAVKKGGSGCYCPENTMIRALVSHLCLLCFRSWVALVVNPMWALPPGSAQVRQPAHEYILLLPDSRRLPLRQPYLPRAGCRRRG